MTELPVIDFDTDHNVYILGAGFSRYAGLPLLNDFLVRMRESVPWLEGNDHLTEAQAVREVLRFRKDAASAAHRVDIDVENIEELFSLASASGDDKLSRDIALAICGTIDFASQQQATHTRSLTFRRASRALAKTVPSPMATKPRANASVFAFRCTKHLLV